MGERAAGGMPGGMPAGMPGERSTDHRFETEPVRFLRQVMPQLVGALTIRTGSRPLAEELAQEAMARAWAEWGRVSTMENPTGWVFRVAFNLAASHWRRAAAGRRAERRHGRGESSFQLQTAETVAIRQALTALSPRQQQILILRYYAQFSVDETADVLGVSSGTVKTQTHRAMARLRHVLGDGDDGD